MNQTLLTWLLSVEKILYKYSNFISINLKTLSLYFNICRGKGLDPERIEAVLHQVDLQSRNQGDKFGLHLAMASLFTSWNFTWQRFQREKLHKYQFRKKMVCKNYSNLTIKLFQYLLRTWSHDADPLEYLSINEQMSHFRRKLSTNPHYLRDKVKEYFIVSILFLPLLLPLSSPNWFHFHVDNWVFTHSLEDQRNKNEWILFIDCVHFKCFNFIVSYTFKFWRLQYSRCNKSPCTYPI